MSFKKLHPQLVENLNALNIKGVRLGQKEVFRSIRAGKNLLVIGKPATGKTFLTALTTLLRVPEPQEGSPRAVIVCATDDDAIALHEQLSTWAKRMDLTLDLAHNRGKQLQQRNDIFDGTEIVIGTTKRLYDLYIQNGLNLNLLKLFAVEDAHEVFRGTNPGDLIRMSESLPKCQVLLTATHSTEKIERFCEQMDVLVQTQSLSEVDN